MLQQVACARALHGPLFLEQAVRASTGIATPADPTRTSDEMNLVAVPILPGHVFA
jgi:hypothetical protein